MFNCIYLEIAANAVPCQAVALACWRYFLKPIQLCFFSMAKHGKLAACPKSVLGAGGGRVIKVF
ncbi:hypothetical protein DCM91_19830 [Chitinophaga costaii]|nr:hypothetical protein DCM91_19830 [Chitinophaga costaii]